MRKLVLAAVAALALLAVAGVAYAANTYSLDSAKATPKGVGTPAKPVPKAIEFDYSVDTTDDTRPSPVKSYSIGFQGLVSFAKHFPKCSFAQANQKSLTAVKQACGKADVGGGVVENETGTSTDPTQKLPCKLKLRLYNTGKGLAIRLDRDKVADCAIDPSTALDGRFKRRKLGGVPTDFLNFTVTDNLLHPAGLDNAVVRAQSNVKRLRTKAKVKGVRRTVGLYSSIGCGKKKKRQIQVLFTAESGQKSTASKTVRC